MRTGRMGIALAVSMVVVALVLGACGGSDEGSADGATADTGQIVEAEGNVVGMSGGNAGGGDEARMPDVLGAPAPDEGSDSAAYRTTTTGGLTANVIKTATLELEVEKGSFQDAVRDGIAAAERYGGFVLTTEVEDEEEGRGAITLRVPSARFGAALADLESLGDVKREVVSGQDVSQEYVDLQARLRHALAQESVMLELMERAQTIPDTIRVQGQLEGIQLEIERLRGRIRFLNDQTDLSTIEVRLHEAGAVATKEGEFAKAWARAKEAFVAIVAGLITSLGVIVPLALLIGLIVITVAVVRPRISSKPSAP
ncbi:MAG: DUF4349 domain-containing protein [Actinomycetota bacterium]